MFGIGYVIIPTEFSSLQSELDRTLAPFMRGGPEDFPMGKLDFEDSTDVLRAIYQAHAKCELTANGLSFEAADSNDIFYIDTSELRAFIESTGKSEWSGRFADVYPNFHDFARRFATWKTCVDGRYGRWLNFLGRWDWWDLGGRFDGFLTGQRRKGRVETCMIASGSNSGRDLIGGITRALGAEPSDVEAEIEGNVDLVSPLIEAARRKERHAFPTAIVLPMGACADEFRWFDSLGWRPIPPQTQAFLGLGAEATFDETALAAYQRFSAMAVAGIAYHF